MNRRFTNIRYRYIQSHLYGLFLTLILLLSILLSIYVLFQPEWISAGSIFFFAGLYALIGIVISGYVGFQSSGDIKERLDNLSMQITQFANGNYQARLYSNEKDEISRIENEMNELGDKLQKQVMNLQRMADEKAEFSKSAHKAAVMEERQRIARELHDAVSQQLFALTMMSEAAVKQYDKDPETAMENIEEVAKSALQAQTEMRALLLHLRPVNLSGESLSEGIHKLVDELKQKLPIRFDVSVEEGMETTDAIDEQVFRIIQEALSNILRHADAAEVKVHVYVRNQELFVHIADDGEGFDVRNNRKTSYGLKTMEERSEEIGGTFNVRSVEKEGTYIDIRIPC